MNNLALLSTLLLNDGKVHQSLSVESDAENRQKALASLVRFSPADFLSLTKFASDHHVVVRSLEILSDLVREAKDQSRIKRVDSVLNNERARIAHALFVLESICRGCEAKGLEVVVIKSLDHWPDLGSDLDLYTNADPADVRSIMTHDFNARPEERSWGDRLAGKWNFRVPGLPELVEFHVGRLGQTGEQVRFARRLIDRAVFAQMGGHQFRVPAPEDRLMISTLQRMYRHFYFRLCDIVDTVHLLEHQTVDFNELRTSAERAGIWHGTATYLSIASDYSTRYRGKSPALPAFVTAAARFGGDDVSFRKGFLRVPIVPHSIKLFAAQLASVVGSRNIRGAARLSLLPWLATTAAVAQKLSGSDKGVW
jgi:hypothetical protein